MLQPYSTLLLCPSESSSYIQKNCTASSSKDFYQHIQKSQSNWYGKNQDFKAAGTPVSFEACTFSHCTHLYVSHQDGISLCSRPWTLWKTGSRAMKQTIHAHTIVALLQCSLTSIIYQQTKEEQSRADQKDSSVKIENLQLKCQQRGKKIMLSVPVQINWKPLTSYYHIGLREQ